MIFCVFVFPVSFWWISLLPVFHFFYSGVTLGVTFSLLLLELILKSWNFCEMIFIMSRCGAPGFAFFTAEKFSFTNMLYLLGVCDGVAFISSGVLKRNSWFKHFMEWPEYNIVPLTKVIHVQKQINEVAYRYLPFSVHSRGDVKRIWPGKGWGKMLCPTWTVRFTSCPL